MYYDELYHHGIKGQRWGVRRFQNKDGSLTRLGQKRADRQAKAAAKEYEKRAARGEYSLDSKFESISGRTVKSGRRRSGPLDGAGAAIAGLAAVTAGAKILSGTKGKGDSAFKPEKKGGSPAEKILNNTSSITSSLAKGLGDRSNAKAAKEANKIDLSHASDQEIRDYVNRYNLEKQFRQITAEQYSSGQARTKEMIETIGAVASVGASIAGIIVAYNKIKNG